MLTRLVVLILGAVALTSCVADVPDNTATSTSTPATSVAPTAEGRRPALTAEVSPTPSITVATVTPTRVAVAVGTPEGSTGLDGARTEGVEYSESCFGGEDDEASPPAGPIEPTPRGAVTSFPGPYTAIPYVQDDTLQSLLDGVMGDKEDSYAFFVKDLATGRGAMLNSGEVFNAASLFKLFVMYEIFHEENLGLVEWSDELVVTPYYDAFALSPRVTELCQVVTVGEAMEAMLSVSDNAAAVLLQDLASSRNVNSAIEALGLTQSGLFEDGLPVTADDLALLMEAIATGNAISPEASADMLKLLDHDVFENGLLSGLPPGTVVSRKTGNWSDATNVAGVVYAPSGPYVFVALTTNGYETHIIQALSTTAYEYFEALRAQAAP